MLSTVYSRLSLFNKFVLIFTHQGSGKIVPLNEKDSILTHLTAERVISLNNAISLYNHLAIPLQHSATVVEGFSHGCNKPRSRDTKEQRDASKVTPLSCCVSRTWMSSQLECQEINKEDFLQVFQGSGIGKIEYNLTSADPLYYTTNGSRNIILNQIEF